MNRETITKAAKEYAEENPWYPGETSYESDIREMEEKFADAYIAGANWRINSAWHDATKFKPRHGSKVAVLVGGKDITVWNFENGMEQAFSCMSIKCWAYIDDLIPDRKEADQ